MKTLVDVATFLGRLVGKTRVKTLPVKEHSDSARRAATSRVPFLLTLDLHTRLELPRELDACLDHLAQADIRATFFTPAVLARNALVKEGLRRCVRDGHQLACHGLLHRAPEDFVHDPLEVQVVNLRRAKTMLEDVVAREITAFRAPSFLISANTLLALEHCGFRVDVSVNSRRLPFLSSQVGNFHWLLAPGRPYHPNATNPYRRGDLRIWELPVSGFALPFISTLYQSLGLGFTRAFATLLLAEARLRYKPVVYMGHPEEFYPSRHVRPATYHLGAGAAATLMDWRLFVPVKNAGFRFRWLLYERDEFKIYDRSVKMLRFLASRSNLEFFTVDQYLERLEGGGAQTGHPARG